MSVFDEKNHYNLLKMCVNSFEAKTLWNEKVLNDETKKIELVEANFKSFCLQGTSLGFLKYERA